jgi:hypothetical protein
MNKTQTKEKVMSNVTEDFKDLPLGLKILSVVITLILIPVSISVVVALIYYLAKITDCLTTWLISFW